MTEIAELQQGLWREMLAGGVLAHPTPAIEAAFFGTPRHQFVQRYSTWHNREWRADGLAEIYTDNSLILAAGNGEDVASTCSMPSYILSLVQWLDIQPGHQVLEIGSGCGWLVAVMAHLVGPGGHVFGVEILPDLARASRVNLAEIRNCTIHCGDGRDGFKPGAPYDRIIATAGMNEIPPALIEQARLGARLVLPIRTDPNTTACAVRLYQRTARDLDLISERPGFFVPCVEGGRNRVNPAAE